VGLDELGAEGFDLASAAAGGRIGHRRPPCLRGLSPTRFSAPGGLRVHAVSQLHLRAWGSVIRCSACFGRVWPFSGSPTTPRPPRIPHPSPTARNATATPPSAAPRPGPPALSGRHSNPPSPGRTA